MDALLGLLWWILLLKFHLETQIFSVSSVFLLQTIIPDNSLDAVYHLLCSDESIN